MVKFLIVDDERSIQNVLKEALEHEGYQVSVAENAREAISRLNNESCDLVLCDTKYSRMDGEDVLELIHNRRPSTRIISISWSSEVESVIDLMKRGSVDFLTKPISLNKLLNSVKTSMDGAVYGQTPAVVAKPAAARRPGQAEKIVGESAAIAKVKEMISKVAPSDARVLITGANGTGKELVAHWLHELSPRNTKPFVEVNCAAIPSELIESELFGHEKGAFTSAVKDRKGKFELANGGTLFLDEIGDMSLSAQAKVLRALQDRKISRVGGDKDMAVNVRVITATNKNLREEIERHAFREDLYHRLNVVNIHVPDLDERLDDIPLLVNSFLRSICAEYDIPVKKIAPDAMAELQKMKWPGNIRQLHNITERLVVLSDNEITLDDVLKYC